MRLFARSASVCLSVLLCCLAFSVAFADDAQVKTGFILCEDFGEHAAAAATVHNISVCAFVLQGEPVDLDLTPSATTSAPAIVGDEFSLRRNLLGGGATPVAVQLAQSLLGNAGTIRTQATTGAGWTVLGSILTESLLISKSLVWAIKDLMDMYRTRPRSAQKLQDATRNVDRAYSNQQTLLLVLNRNPQTQQFEQLSIIRDTVASMTPKFKQLLSLLATWRQQQLHAITRLHFAAEPASLAVTQAAPAAPAKGKGGSNIVVTLDDDDDDDDDEDKKDRNKKDKKSPPKKSPPKSSSGSNSGGKGSKPGKKAKVGATQMINVVVAADGSGDYKSIQAAVDAAGPGSTIRIKAGVYKEQIQVSTDRITMIGAGMDQTVIVYDASQTRGYDIITSATVGVNHAHFPAISLALRPTFRPPPPSSCPLPSSPAPPPQKVVADGWMTWAGETYGGKPFLAEFNSKGPGAKPSRVKWAKPGVTSGGAVSQYNPNSFIQLQSWIGATKIPV
ncbi:unnamed protein product [Closterium sp. Naga37s-1]|nr:unnamed protein product [Closterium sp. Naga37s-1]